MLFKFFSHKPKKALSEVDAWMKLQSYDDDAIVYLIQKEIYENGMRDLGYVIPRLRNDDYFRTLLDKPTIPAPIPTPVIAPEEEIEDTVQSVMNFSDLKTIPERPELRLVEGKVKGFMNTHSEGMQNAFKSRSNLVDITAAYSSELASDTTCFDD